MELKHKALTNLFSHNLGEASRMGQLLVIQSVEFRRYKFAVDDGNQGPDFHEKDFNIVLSREVREVGYRDS